MSKKFDSEAYISRWDNRLIPIMLVFIFASMVGVYAMNIWARPACTTHEYVYCSTPLDLGENEHEAKEEAGSAHEMGGPHIPPGEEAHGQEAQSSVPH